MITLKLRESFKSTSESIEQNGYIKQTGTILMSLMNQPLQLGQLYSLGDGNHHLAAQNHTKETLTHGNMAMTGTLTDPIQWLMV